jgi:hypothetical protein
MSFPENSGDKSSGETGMTAWYTATNLKIMLFLNHNNFASLILNPRFEKVKANVQRNWSEVKCIYSA